jgi:hypothetical protein
MRKSSVIVAVAALLACGLGGALLLNLGGTTERALATSPRPVWNEVPWPFPMDQWGKGKAFACRAADCGTDVTVYIRAKIGFCNCATGVSDDEELDRISDFDLFGSQLTAQGPGQPITVAWMKGRSRAFTIVGPQRSGKSALSVGFNDRCDAIVATAVLALDRPAVIEPAVLAFLNSSTVLRWAEVTLGL